MLRQIRSSYFKEILPLTGRIPRACNTARLSFALLFMDFWGIGEQISHSGDGTERKEERRCSGVALNKGREENITNGCNGRMRC